MMNQFCPTVSEIVSQQFHGGSFAQIIAVTPRYLGADAMVRTPLSRHTTPSTGDQHALIRGKDGTIRAVLNACPHRNNQLFPVGLIVNGVRGQRAGSVSKNDSVICPYHRYTYNAKGEFTFAPVLAEGDEKPCLTLNNIAIEKVGSLIFEAGCGATEMLQDVWGEESFARLGIVPFHLKGTVLHSVEETQEIFSALDAMEVFGDTDHVDDIHQTSFNQLVDMQNLWLVYGKHWSIQFVGWREKTTKVCKEYQDYRDAVLSAGNTPLYGAVWMMFGPYTTFEWYPTDVEGEHVFVVSTFVPQDGGGCRNVIEWYVPEALLLRNPELVTKLKAAYGVTASEDRELCISTKRGRRALVDNGYSEQKLGPIHPREEGCIGHYYNLLHMYLITRVNKASAVQLRAA